MDYKKTIQEFFDSINEKINKGEISRYSRLEILAIESYAQWLHENYRCTKKKSIKEDFPYLASATGR